MAVDFSLTNTFQGVVKLAGQLQTDAKFAARAALTKSASQARKDITAEMKNKLDRPVPWIANMYWFDKATDLDNPRARVYVRDRKRQAYADSIAVTGKNIRTPGSLRFGKEVGLIRGQETLIATRNVRRNARGNVTAANYQKLWKLGRSERKRVVTKGRKRGLYTGTGKTWRLALVPITPKRYKPRVNVTKLVDNVLKDLPKLTQELTNRNIAKTLQKRLQQK